MPRNMLLPLAAVTVAALAATAVSTAAAAPSPSTGHPPSVSAPLVLGHRGAAGYRPHTGLGYSSGHTPSATRTVSCRRTSSVARTPPTTATPLPNTHCSSVLAWTGYSATTPIRRHRANAVDRRGQAAYRCLTRSMATVRATPLSSREAWRPPASIPGDHDSGVQLPR